MNSIQDTLESFVPQCEEVYVKQHDKEAASGVEA
jgi:hypothetical protein